MTHEAKHFTIVDPRAMDGDCFEVAQRACLQAAALARLLAGNLEVTELMARNAEMERQIIKDGEPNAAAWDSMTQAKNLKALVTLAKESEKRLTLIAKAAGYNPKRPPTE